MEYYSVIKKNNAICSNMDRTRDSHTKSERERQIPYHLYLESNIWHKCIYLQEKNKQTNEHGEQACSCQGGVGGSGMDWELGLVDVNYCISNG